MKRFSYLQKITQAQWLILYLLAAFLIVSKIMYNQHGWVNNDSLLYFEQARLLAAGQWQQAHRLFSWPFYPSLLALIHRSTGLEIHSAAIGLNIVCFVLFVAGFQQLLLEAGAKLRTLHWGHGLLFSTQYMVGSVLGMLLRDEGFWAAYTWGLVYWLRSLKTQRWQDLLAFQAVMVIATLFRIEAAVYLLALPLCALAYTGLSASARLKLWLRANSLSLLTALMLGIALFAGVLRLDQLGRLQEIFTQVTRLFGERIDFIQQKAAIINQQVLGEDLDEYGLFSLWVTLILIAISKTLKTAGLPALIAICWPKQSWWSRLPAPARHLALATLSVSFVVSLVILLNVFVLSSRYVIASGIVFIFLAAFAMTEWQSRWPKLSSRGVACLLVAMLAYSLWDRNPIDLDRQAVDYIQTINPQQQPVFYDTENARFYAHQPYQDRVLGHTLFPELVKQQAISKYDYYMITISKDAVDVAYEQLAVQTLQKANFKLVKTFYGWRGKSKVMIFSKQAVIP
ncbi:hypothetical protein [Methylophilus sp. YYY-1]|uniref:hypothetical protein n=1 Tax=Methylophilus sp. YYY-1 TaxID=2682087 RepID=UPI0023B25BE7|nr:hypothetical protein [Methylophilus sp. YYY-1]MDF0378552.1 hypothetical protein [Methylophilus sp. YYY-1]